MLKFKRITKEVEDIFVEDVLCNMCGESCPGYRSDQTGHEPECVTIDQTWGYWSKKDMFRQQAHICEECWDSLAQQFKIPVTEIDLMDPPGEARPDEDQAPQGDYEDDEDDGAYSICRHCECPAGSHATYVSGLGCGGCGNCSSSFEDVVDYARTYG